MTEEIKAGDRPWWALFWPKSLLGRIAALTLYGAIALAGANAKEILAWDRTPPNLIVAKPVAGTEISPATVTSIELVFDEPLKACTIDTGPAAVSGKTAKLELRSPADGTEWHLSWRAVDRSGNSSGDHALVYPLTQDRIVGVDIDVTTGADDKECGEFITEVFYGGTSVLRRGYGSIDDDRCTTDDPREYWGPGHHELYADQPVTSRPTVVGGRPVHVVCTLAERRSEVNIRWDALITIRVRTQFGRVLSFSGSKTFDTNGGDKKEDGYDMETQAY